MVLKKNNFSKFIVFLILALLLVFLDYFKILNPVKGLFESRLIIPIRLKLGRFNGSQDQNLSCECQDEKEQILKLETQIAALKEENLSSRRLLGAPLPSGWRFLPVKVLGRQGDRLIIDKGEKDQISLGTVAVTDGVYLGKISQISQEISKLSLVFSPETKEAVKILDKESLVFAGKGLLLGKSEGKMAIKEILAEEDVSPGDLVVISVKDGDLPLGKITSVDYEKGNVFKTAEVESEVKVRSLETVFLVTGEI